MAIQNKIITGKTETPVDLNDHDLSSKQKKPLAASKTDAVFHGNIVGGHQPVHRVHLLADEPGGAVRPGQGGVSELMN
jgi:hypothetical protein